MKKPVYVPLKRENRRISDDAQFSQYFPSKKWIVFYEYGHPTHQASQMFKTKKEAELWIVWNAMHHVYPDNNMACGAEVWRFEGGNFTRSWDVNCPKCLAMRI